ncbi:MAG: methyltransferase domain-containing protein [Myxococcales bacterium]|nr:methyltransferase domain-containing protein [Myxococcales bacterium]
MGNEQAFSKHEQFDVDGRGTGAHQIRQDRFEPAEWTCRAIFGGHDLGVCNYSAFGLAVLGAAPVEHDEPIDASVWLREIEVARVRLRRVRVEPLADGRYKTAFAIVGEPLSLARLDAVGRAQTAVDEHHRSLEEAAAVPARFRADVYEMRDALEALEARINALADNGGGRSLGETRELEVAVAEVVAAHLDGLIRAACERLVDVTAALDAKDMQRCYDFFRRQLAHLLYQSPLFERSYHKPLGYAGDFEMMALIYRNEELGGTLFAKCLSRYYMNHPNARAVRNRAVYLHRRLERTICARAGGKLRILSVAAGPAREIQMLLEDESLDLSNVEVDLLDQDVTALQSAQQSLQRAVARRQSAAPTLRFVHKAMANVVKGGLDGRYDVIYSAGLFDYFSDALARRAALRLHRLLEDGGELIVGNFCAVPENRAFMELALDWELIYRSADELRALYAGVTPAIEVDAEPEQINLFVTLRR